MVVVGVGGREVTDGCGMSGKRAVTTHSNILFWNTVCVSNSRSFGKVCRIRDVLGESGQRKATYPKVHHFSTAPDGPDGPFAEAAATGSLRGEFAPPSPLQDADLCNWFRNWFHSPHTPIMARLGSTMCRPVSSFWWLGFIRSRTCEM